MITKELSGLFLVLLLFGAFIPIALADCDSTAFNDATVNAPTSLQHNYDGTSLITDQSHVTFSCDNAVNDYLNPDTNANGEYHLLCNGTAFEIPNPWPECVKKCTPPQPQTGYLNLESYDPVSVGTTVYYNCTDTNFYPGGNAPTISHSLTCQDTGEFPTGTWPTCTAMCEVPVTYQGYNPDAAHAAGTYVDVDTVLSFDCSGANEYVGDTSTSIHNMTCQPDGTLSPSPDNWPSCVKKCETPLAQLGYDDQLTSDLINVGNSLTFNCTMENHFPGGDPSTNGYTITCQTDGTFPTEIWPTCIAKCLAPAAETGYLDNNVNEGKYFSVNDSIAYQCAGSNEISGNSTSNEHIILCGEDGMFPQDSWPSCVVKCLVPEPEPGYAAQTDLTPVEIGGKLTFECLDAGATVGEAMDNATTITCQSDGTFPSGWEPCDVRCVVPTPTNGSRIAPQPETITTVVKGTKLTYSCEIYGETIGDTLQPLLDLTCADDGSFPDPTTWPSCAMRCPVPSPEPGFLSQPTNTPPGFVGDKLKFFCSTDGFTVGKTMLEYHEIECQPNGKYPTGWPECALKCAIPNPEPDYSNSTTTNPVLVGESVTFPCKETGAIVEGTFSHEHKITCQTDGTFPSGWPTCSVQCTPPKAEPGYNSLPAGTLPVDVGQNLTYHCMYPGALSGDTSVNYHTITCGPDGQFPSGWPTCETRCLVPDPESGYAAYTGAEVSVAVGETISFNCADPEAEAGNTMSNSYGILCGSDGSFPTGWPICAIPETCHDPPDPNSANTSLTLSPETQTPIKAYRSATYVCTDSSQTTDEGSSIDLLCLASGKYESRSTWPECRAKVECTEAIPTPSPESGLGESNSTVSLEGDQATYTCNQTDWNLDNGLTEFSITCQSDGTFGTFSWPTCQDPLAVFNQDSKRPCYCLGDLDEAKVGNLRDVICRNITLKTVGSRTPPSRMRCGTTDPDNISPERMCFCDSPLDQSETSHWYTLRLKSDPWQWFEDSNGINQLLKPGSSMHKSLRDRVLESLDTAILADATLGSLKYVTTSLYGFRKGSEAPIGIFAYTKPTAECPESLLQDLTLPERLTRVGSGPVPSGSDAVFKCSGTNDALFEAGTNAFVSGQEVRLACDQSGSSFTGIPAEWPSCVAINNTCPVPTPDAAKGYADQPAGTTEIDAGSSLTFTCSDATHVVSGTTSNTYNAKCIIIGKNTDPWYDVTIETAVTDWPACEAPAKRRKKRATSDSGYNYILVDLETQFLDENSPTLAEFEAFLADLGGLNGSLASVVIDKDCPTDVCTLQNQPDYCSNSFFENLPVGYEAQTSYGFYVPPIDAASVDASNRIIVGEIAELRCTSTNPMQYPLRDDHDHDPNDNKLTVFCMPPDTLDGSGQWSLSIVPDCASVCTEYLHDGPIESDLILTGVIPFVKPNITEDYKKYNKSTAHLYAGDKLVYQCKTEFWGVNGGVDLTTEQFKCTNEGFLNTPTLAAEWPHCKPQTNMIINAVELMLDRYDRRISDRYKLIAYREEDFNKNLKDDTNYFLNYTVPTMIALAIIIALCCCCSRDASPVCKLCRSNV